MKLTKQQTEQIKALASELEMDLIYFIEDSDAESIDELTDYLQDQNAFDIEVVYYDTAMEMLSKYDNSLRESCELASDMGYETKNLNSELLASILASELERQEYHNIESELVDILFG